MEPSPLPASGTEQDQLRAVRVALHGRFDGAVGHDLVERELEEAVQRFAGARIRDYLPILVERRARDRLAAAAPRAGGRVVTPQQKDPACAERAGARRWRRRRARPVDDRSLVPAQATT